MSGRLLYLIDDDDAARESTSFLLQVKGYEVESFSSAEEFLEAVLDPQGPVLADIELPGMSGLQLPGKLRDERCLVAVALISAHVNDETLKRAVAAGAAFQLQKPVAPNVLLDAVEQCFELGV